MASADEYEVSFTLAAEQNLAEIAKTEARKVLKLAERMKQYPTAGAAQLRYTTEEIWRKRLGDIRVIFTVDKEKRKVTIVKIAWRRDDTYDDV